MTDEELAGAAADAVTRIGRQLGAEVVPEGADPAQLLAPAAALRVARQVELAAHNEVGLHIRRAREDGLSWPEIGGLLGFGPLAADADVPVADYAFDYTVGPRSEGFCDKRQDQVEQLIVGPGDVAICTECVDLCNEIIADARAMGPRPPRRPAERATGAS